MTDNDIINCTSIIKASKTTVQNKSETHTATSFLIKYNDIPYLVTNKHVIFDNPSIEIKLRCENCITGKIYNSVTINFTQGDDTKYHSDYDIAAIPMNIVIQDYINNNYTRSIFLIYYLEFKKSS